MGTPLLVLGLLSYSGVENLAVPLLVHPGRRQVIVAQFAESLLENAQNACVLAVASCYSWFQCCCPVEKVRKTAVAAGAARCRDRAFEVEIRPCQMRYSSAKSR